MLMIKTIIMTIIMTMMMKIRDDDDALKGPGPKVGSCAVEHDFYSFVCISRLLIQQPHPIKRW